MTTCLILAAGNAERHNGGNKPLLKVNGETLLHRTLKLLDHAKRLKPIIVTNRKDLMDSEPDYPVFEPSGSRWIVETLLSTRKLWSQQGATIVALGDVFYTKHAMQEMFNPAWHGVAFGKGSNIHGLRWDSENSGAIANFLERSIKSAEEHPHSHGAGKLWLFVECAGLPVIDFGDETTDFDSPQEHQRFIAKYGNRSTDSTGKAD